MLIRACALLASRPASLSVSVFHGQPSCEHTCMLGFFTYDCCCCPHVGYLIMQHDVFRHAKHVHGGCRHCIAPQAGGHVLSTSVDSRHQTCSCMPVSRQLAHPWCGLPCPVWCASAPCPFMCGCLRQFLNQACWQTTSFDLQQMIAAWEVFGSKVGCSGRRLNEAHSVAADAADELPFTVPVQLHMPAMDDEELSYVLPSADASSCPHRLPSISGMLLPHGRDRSCQHHRRWMLWMHLPCAMLQPWPSHTELLRAAARCSCAH